MASLTRAGIKLPALISTVCLTGQTEGVGPKKTQTNQRPDKKKPLIRKSDKGQVLKLFCFESLATQAKPYKGLHHIRCRNKVI